MFLLSTLRKLAVVHSPVPNLKVYFNKMDVFIHNLLFVTIVYNIKAEACALLATKHPLARC